MRQAKACTTRFQSKKPHYVRPYGLPGTLCRLSHNAAHRSAITLHRLTRTAPHHARRLRLGRQVRQAKVCTMASHRTISLHKIELSTSNTQIDSKH